MASPHVDEAAAMCLLMLEGECATDELRAALQTLQKILSNVNDHPTEEKYRTIRKENKSFKEKVWRFEGCQQFLLSSGWIEVDDTIVLPDHSGLSGALQAVNQQLRNLPQQPAKQTAPVKTSYTDKELEAKEKKIREERELMLHRLKREKEEKKRIADQIKADRQEANSKEHKDSVATERRFGANIKKFSDIGVDVNSGGG